MVNTQKILIEKKSRKKRINEKNTNNEYRITEKVLKTAGGGIHRQDNTIN